MGNGSSEAQEKDSPPASQGLTATKRFDISQGPTSLAVFFLMETILTNSKARHEYHIEETFEAGIVLTGTEVKSLRAGKGQIRDAFARVEKDEVWLYNVHISEYSHGNTANHQPKAARKLLLHKREIRKLFSIAAVKGKALIPLAFYWKNGKVKVQLAVGSGKGVADKRETIKKRDSDRELQQTMMRRR